MRFLPRELYFGVRISQTSLGTYDREPQCKISFLIQFVHPSFLALSLSLYFFCEEESAVVF